jgi:hypothetical protein
MFMFSFLFFILHVYVLIFIQIFDWVCVDALRKDDWDAAQIEIINLQAQGKILYYQPYAPKDEDPKKRPFVVVIQDDFMRKSALRFSGNNSWALDSTFKTNQYGLPLYAAIVPNQDGIGIPVFYMLCSNDVKEGHEGLAIEIALSHVFGSLGEVRPSAIIIDKHKPSLNAIQRVVSNDVHCWTYEEGTKTQVGGQVLLCHFHVMKAWSENLLTKVPNEDKDRVWRALHVLMLCPSEDHFDENLRRFCVQFQHIPTFAKYVISGWAGIHCPWRRLWPRFGRLFAYGGMDTTNHVERHWELIKYTLLQGKVNRSLRDLIVAIVGSAKDGTRVGQPTLLSQFRMTQRLSKSLIFVYYSMFLLLYSFFNFF